MGGWVGAELLPALLPDFISTPKERRAAGALRRLSLCHPDRKADGRWGRGLGTIQASFSTGGYLDMAGTCASACQAEFKKRAGFIWVFIHLLPPVAPVIMRPD